MNQLLKIVGVMLFTAVALSMLGGCSVNIIVAPDAVLSVDSGNERNTGLTFEDAPLYDCVAGPDSDVCQ